MTLKRARLVVVCAAIVDDVVLCLRDPVEAVDADGTGEVTTGLRHPLRLVLLLVGLLFARGGGELFFCGWLRQKKGVRKEEKKKLEYLPLTFGRGHGFPLE